MRVLFLSQRVPYPPNRGDKITTWRLVERMARDHEVRIVAFAHDEADLDAARALRDKGFAVAAFPLRSRVARIRSLPLLFTKTPMTLGVFGSKRLQAEVDRWAAESDVGYAYSSSMGAFLLPHTSLRRVMHFAELDSDKWRQYAAQKSMPAAWIYGREHRTLRAFEERVAHAFDANVFCTALEERIFQEAIPGAPSAVLRNGVDLEYFAPRPDDAEPGHLVFTGVMDYYPNVDGCLHFAEEVLPRVRKEFPEAHFTIIGAHPTAAIQKLAARPGIEVTGFVDDVRDHMAKGAVAVAPLRIARGIQNKVLEALAMGLPVVGTTSATQGVEAGEDPPFRLADTAEDQASAICDLLRNPPASKELGARGRRFVEERYDWDVVLEPLDRLLGPA